MKKTTIKLDTPDAMTLANLLIGINQRLAEQDKQIALKKEQPSFEEARQNGINTKIMQMSSVVVGQIHRQHPELITKKQ